jgi:hypothetical protein
MSNDDAEPWEWLFGGRYDGLTLTFTRGLTPAGLLQRYDADPSAARPLPFTDIRRALKPDIDHAILRVGVVGEWAFGIEDNGAQGTAPATLAQLSRGTETISIFRGANAFAVFCDWVSGQPREQFEPGMASTLRAAGPHPFWDAAERYHAARPGIRAILAVMRAVEDHTGARLAQETDDGPLPTLLLTQIRPFLPSPVPPLPLVDPPANPGKLGRHLATLRLPNRSQLRVREDSGNRRGRRWRTAADCRVAEWRSVTGWNGTGTTTIQAPCSHGAGNSCRGTCAPSSTVRPPGTSA